LFGIDDRIYHLFLMLQKLLLFQSPQQETFKPSARTCKARSSKSFTLPKFTDTLFDVANWMIQGNSLG